MITTALVIFGKFILSTLLLLAFYSGVLRSKASYTMQRLYLILIPFASIMMSGLTFEVYKPEARIIEMEKPEVMQYYEDHRTTGYAIIADEGGSLESLDVSLVDDLFSAIQNVAEELGIIGLVVCALFAVSAVLLMIAAYYIIKMCILRRRLNAEMTDDGYRLICSGSIKVPFSFADTIFLPADMESGKADYILMHEKAHIAHKHYVDVWIIEFMTRLLWFNPLMWVVRRQLRNVHEYEADRCVVDAGVDMFRYQTILLEEVAEDSMVIANGFYHSFIRSRFIEMKKSAIGCMGIKGKTGTVLWIIALFCAFTFTVGEAETIVRYKDAEKHDKEVVVPEVPVAEDVVEEEPESVEEEIADEDADTDNSETAEEVGEDIQEDLPTHASDGYPYVDNLPLNTNQSISREGFYIKRLENETHVVCVGTCEEEGQWFWLGSDQTYIEDTETGDHYKARRSLTKDCWNSFHVRGMVGKTFALTVVFPPLPEDVKNIRFWHLCSWLDLNMRTLSINSYIEK